MLASEWLHHAPVDVLDAVAAVARRHRYKDGATIFSRGDGPTSFFLVVAGRVRIRRMGADGREAVYWLLSRNHWFGEISLLDGKPRTHDAIAVGDTELLALSRKDFHRILAAYPEGMQRIVQGICARLRGAFDLSERAAQAPLDALIAVMLLQLADRTEKVVQISTEDLGQIVNRTRQTVAKRLAAWEKAGIVRRRYRQIELLNPAELRRLAQSRIA